MLFSTHVNHVSVSPTNRNEPTQGQRKTLTRVGIEPTTLSGPFPLIGLTLTWFTWVENSTSHHLLIVNPVEI